MLNIITGEPGEVTGFNMRERWYRITIKYPNPKKCRDKKRRKRSEAPVLHGPGVGVVVWCREKRPSWRSIVDLMSEDKWVSFEIRSSKDVQKRGEDRGKFMKSYLRFLWG